MEESSAIARLYFEDHPEAKDEVMKAFHARHVVHFSEHPKAHFFTTGHRDTPCRWCGRTREQVRWDDLPPECAARPDDVPCGHDAIARIIRLEEEKAFACREKASKIAPKAFAKNGQTEAVFDWLWDTHGIDRETALEFA